MSKTLITLTLTLCALVKIAPAEPLLAFEPSAPQEGNCHEPSGTIQLVRVNGVIMDGLLARYWSDGTWEMTLNGTVVGYGVWWWGLEGCTIDYFNLSTDGGGGQSGTYTWDEERLEWERTWASSPSAPPLSLVSTI